MDIYKLAELNNVQVKDCGKGHLQLQGKLLVNYYPDSKNSSAYVAGTTKSIKHVTPLAAIKMTMEQPKPSSNKAKRAKQKVNKKRKAILYKKRQHCYWCKTPLTLKTSTLEHIIPLHRGGLDNMNNLTLACGPCNHERDCDMPELNN